MALSKKKAILIVRNFATEFINVAKYDKVNKKYTFNNQMINFSEKDLDLVKDAFYYLWSGIDRTTIKYKKEHPNQIKHYFIF